MSEKTDTNATKDDFKGPSMNGTITGHKPQWRHSPEWTATMNKRLGMEGGADWTDVPVTIIRGGLVVHLPDGREVSFGIPFPRIMPGILETIYMFGYEQAQALAWCFSASAASVGATIEVRVQDYKLDYGIKTERLSSDAALGESLSKEKP